MKKSTQLGIIAAMDASFSPVLHVPYARGISEAKVAEWNGQPADTGGHKRRRPKSKAMKARAKCNGWKKK